MHTAWIALHCDQQYHHHQPPQISYATCFAWLLGCLVAWVCLGLLGFALFCFAGLLACLLAGCGCWLCCAVLVLCCFALFLFLFYFHFYLIFSWYSPLLPCHSSTLLCVSAQTRPVRPSFPLPPSIPSPLQLHTEIGRAHV